MPMTAFPVFRSLLRAVPAVLAAITVAAAGGAATAQPLPSIPSVPGAVHRLQILPGENSTEASGSVARGKNDSYSIATAPGQRLIFDITSTNDKARVSVAPLIGPQVADEAQHAEFVADGNDYQIAVSSVDGAADDYTLTVTVA